MCNQLKLLMRYLILLFLMSLKYNAYFIIGAVTTRIPCRWWLHRVQQPPFYLPQRVPWDLELRKEHVTEMLITVFWFSGVSWVSPRCHLVWTISGVWFNLAIWNSDCIFPPNQRCKWLVEGRPSHKALINGQYTCQTFAVAWITPDDHAKCLSVNSN